MYRIARKIHRIVSYLVFLQVTVWILGGLVFSILPFDSLVKGGALVHAPAPAALPAQWPALAGEQAAGLGGIQRVEAHRSAQGVLVAHLGAKGSLWLRAADGRPVVAPTVDEISAFAGDLYRGGGTIAGTRYLSDPEYRVLGLVDELYGRRDVWQVEFDDRYRTRLYFDGVTGTYLTVRNDLWVLYDAMWRLHIMDYRGGEDFNNRLLLACALLATLFALSGCVLTLQALRRQLHRWRYA